MNWEMDLFEIPIFNFGTFENKFERVRPLKQHKKLYLQGNAY